VVRVAGQNRQIKQSDNFRPCAGQQRKLPVQECLLLRRQKKKFLTIPIKHHLGDTFLEITLAAWIGNWIT